MSGPKNAPYKVICISLFKWDLEQLDKMVQQLKERGLSKANRSWLIRHALKQIQVEQIDRDDVYGENA